MLLIVLPLLTACNTNPKQHEVYEKEIIASSNQTLQLIHSAIDIPRDSETLFSGEVHFFDSELASWSLYGSGKLYSIEKNPYWEADISFKENNFENFQFLEFSSKLSFFIEHPFIYLYPKDLYVSLGTWNIQTKFIQLLSEGLIGSRVRFQSSKIPELSLPTIPLFSDNESLSSWKNLNLDTFQNFLQQFWNNTLILELNGEIKKDKIDIRKMLFEREGEQQSFSWTIEKWIFIWELYNITKDQFTYFKFSPNKNGFDFSIKQQPYHISGNIELSKTTKKYTIILANSQTQGEITLHFEISKGEIISSLQQPPKNYIELQHYLEQMGILQ